MNPIAETVSLAPDSNRRLADFAMVLDLLGTLPGAMNESKVVDAIRDLFTLLCAPARIAYLPAVDGQPGNPQLFRSCDAPHAALQHFLTDSCALYAWTDSSNGFLLRIAHGDETLGVMEVEGLTFPQYKSHYLNLALAMVSVCGLAIHNARIYEKLCTALAEREKAEQKIAQLNAALKRRIAQVEDTNKELEAFSYSVSHDLRAPLHGIDGWSQILLEDCGDKLDAQGRGYLNTIRTETDRMTQLINALLQLARINRNEIHVERVDLSALARELEQTLRIAEPSRQVEVKIAPDVTAHGDPVLLRLVLQNLLGNAWKFTQQCSPARIEFGVLLQAGKPVYFVRDNGAGFDMAYVAKLFAPFQRLHSQKEFTGIGIGLATVQRIIHRHGGTVWAEGIVNQGAAFYFTLNGNGSRHEVPP